ncbi:sigma factor-like helix-turn-helix DNA-binding protein [Nocardiopsis sp. NPDC058789]|uniref:sigma factor-like helix-turn-helix DNA-binding protein n=1 Tax=Nocardiopsis sp. NPDC058789 TaxID=3346634 RepID=UPI00366B8842
MGKSENDIEEWVGELLDQRERDIVTARAEGRTLDEVGSNLGLSRERVRQLQRRSRGLLAERADIAREGWKRTLHEVGSGLATPRRVFAAALGLADHAALDELLVAAGLSRPRTWAGPLGGWWSVTPEALGVGLRRLTTSAPFRGDELDLEADRAGLPRDLPLTALLTHPDSRLALSVDRHWVRRRARGRDAAYLWLLEVGRPCRLEEMLASMDAVNMAAAREALRRDERFRQIRPEGTWALAEWTHLRSSPYTTALEAMVSVVAETGPLTRTQLFARVTELYPVTPWRLKQCLLSDQLGETPSGHIDLASRGARPIEREEPLKPETIASKGQVLGARIPVTRDIVRGSGVTVHPWLTWRLGLRHAPTTRTFSMPDGQPPLTVLYGTSNSQLSSLRLHTLALDVIDGCELVVLFRMDDDTARVTHGCAPDECPGRRGTTPAPSASHLWQ